MTDVEYFDPHHHDEGYSTPGGNPAGPTPNEIHRAALRKAREVRAKLALKPSQAPRSEAGGTFRSGVTDTDPDGLPL